MILLFGIPGGWGMMTILILFSLFCTLLWLIALVSALRNRFKNPNDKIIWVLLIILLPFIGAILYFLIGSKNRVS